MQCTSLWEGLYTWTAALLLRDSLQYRLCRLLASKQAAQQRVLRKEAHGRQQHVHQQRQQRSGPGKLQADQDGPGETRPDGPR